MKTTLVVHTKTDRLLEAYTSEVTWLPLNIGDFYQSGIDLYRVVRKTYVNDDDKLVFEVESCEGKLA